MPGTLLNHFTIKKAYTGIATTKANPKFSYSSTVSGSTYVEGGTATDFFDEVTADYAYPFFCLDATETEPGFCRFYYYNTSNSHLYTPPQNFVSANFLGFQGAVAWVPYGSAGEGETYSTCTINTNIPIFYNVSDAQEWIDSGYTETSKIINYKKDEDLQEYHIYNKYGDANISYGTMDFTSTIFERYEEFTIKGRACLYMPTPFQMSIVSEGDVLGSKFSSISQGVWEVIEDGSLYYSSPFYNRLKASPTTTGEGIRVANYLDTNMLIFTTLEDYEDWLNGNDEASLRAENYDDIANSGNSVMVNPTGDAESETEFNVPTHKDVFNTRYLISSTDLNYLKNDWLFNEDQLDSIVKGLALWGTKPIDYIVDLTYYPFDVSAICGTIPTQTMKFGTVSIGGFTSLKKISSQPTWKNMGTFTLKPTFNSWRDEEPYTRLFVSLPYVGTYPLDIKRYLNKSINVRYYFDFNTRSCCVCLIGNGILLDYFNGQIGINQAVSSNSFQDYANTQINTLLSTAMSGLGGFATAGGVGAVAATTSQIPNMAMNTYEKKVSCMGSSSSMINEYLPQYVYFIFEIMDINESSNLVSLKGKPSNASGQIKNFTGFLSVDSVDLICSGATEEEKNEILALLKAGIRI